MDYSMLNTLSGASPENLSVQSNFTPSIYPRYASPPALAALDERMPPESGSPTATEGTDADDQMSIMDCSRPSSAANTPQPADSMLPPQPESAVPSPQLEATKLKLNFSMDRILSRDTDFCAPKRRQNLSCPAETAGGGGCRNCDQEMLQIGGGDQQQQQQQLAMQQQQFGGGSVPGQLDAMFSSPVSFSVASMLGLTACAGKPVFRPLPVYLSQSVPLTHANTTSAEVNAPLTTGYLSPNSASPYTISQRSPIDRRLTGSGSGSLPPTHPPFGSSVVNHMQLSHQHLHQYLHQSPQQQASHSGHPGHPMHQQHHHHHNHHHQHPTVAQITMVEAVAGAGSGGAAGGAGANNAKRKRSWSRAVFSQLQRKGLEIQFQIQKYITKPDRRKLAARLSLTDAQVKVWFQNRRMKWRHTRETKLGQPHSGHSAHGAKSACDDMKNETSSSSDEDDIDVVAE